jgi:hypothetical protein
MEPKMENKFEHTPEEQGWKAPLPPRPAVPNGNAPGHALTGQNSPVQNGFAQGQLRDNLCAWVCEKLSDLLDNDGSVRPEQAAGIYAHLAICRHCAQEFDEMQRVVALVENLPPAELPRDFSGLIMQRIENPHMPLSKHSLTPQAVADTLAVVVVTNGQRQNAAQSRSATASMQTIEQKTTVLQAQQIQNVQTQQNQSELLRRMTAGGILSAVLAYFVSTAWGRQLLSGNVNAATAWFAQVADTLRGVPVLTWMVGLIFSALAQLNAMLSQTYHVMGAAAAAGFAIDVAVCVVAYSFLTARRRDAQMRY